ncbi:hypothetical protein PanWU01x14_029900 [Parasponia andersonii]|uniref:Uncharacterized protein n=1 Tax=Parasponia andersonii TaxID=3476 RepID=A0A2P5DVR3_PARAD|nr:hypothetical protein PanWU01x14_029900 [Parasponia andersonii]
MESGERTLYGTACPCQQIRLGLGLKGSGPWPCNGQAIYSGPVWWVGLKVGLDCYVQSESQFYIWARALDKKSDLLFSPFLID